MVKSLFLAFLFIFIIIKSVASNIKSNNYGKTPLIYKIEENKLKKNNFADLKINNLAKDTNNKSLMKKNLLIGAITNYDWDKVGVFFGSYQKAKFENCDCVMFVSKMSQRTIKRIESCGVKVYPISNKYIDIPIINSRWKIYEDYLKDNSGKYNLVFTADIRDVFFQRDVFNFYNSIKSFLGIAIEDSTLTEYWNKQWLINAYGEDLYKTMANERIICVGTIWGTSDKFEEFSRIMWEKLSSEWSKRVFVVEQAVGNYLIYHDKIFSDCLIKSNNTDGFILTIATTKRKDIIIDKNNYILNRNGLVGAVIHQYDRFPDLLNMAILKYCPELSPIFLTIIIEILLCLILFKFKSYISKRDSALIKKNQKS